MKKTLVLFAFSSLLFAACTKTPVNQPPLGPISATGTLIPAEVSLLRRGTHLFLVNGKKMYYVESKTEDLLSAEGQTVHVEGIAESNTSTSDLPVLVLTKLTSVSGESGLHIWNIPALDIRIQTPNGWAGTIQKNVASFLLPGEKIPLLVITVSESAALPANGTQYYLGGHRAVRINGDAGSGKIDVLVQGKDFILQLHFDASTQTSLERAEDAKLVMSEFEYVLSSLQFLSDKKNSATGSGSDVSAPCGGEGNVVCPQGFFCDIVDQEAKIGKCRAIKS